MGLSIKRAPGEHRALLMGVFQAIYALGMFAGPALSGFIAGSRGVAAVFTSSGLLVLATIPFLSMGLRFQPAQREKNVA
jgi:MFS family permease